METELIQIKRECPYCHTNRIESMGFRDETNTVRRFRCKNPDCLRTHSRDAKTNEVLTGEKEMIEDKPQVEKADKTLNVTLTTKTTLLNLKIFPRETIDDIINRILKENTELKEKLKGG